MPYPKQFINMQFTGGVVRDTAPTELGINFLTNVSNVNFRGGFPNRILGSRNIYTAPIASANVNQIVHVINAAQVAGLNRWLIFEGNGEAWAINDASANQIDNSLLQSVEEPYKHSSSLLNGLPIYSNSVDEPVYWAGGNLITLPDWTATESCKFIAVLKFHIFALNISGPSGTFSNLLKWSSAAEPGTVPSSWTPAADNDAGSVELSDSPGELLCAYPLADSLIIYKNNSMYSATFIGGNEVFDFRKIQSSSGALSSRSVCDINGRHLVVTEGDIVITDGVSVQSIGEGIVKNYLFSQLDENNFRNLFCVYNPARNEAIIAFPTVGNTFCNKALIYDINSQVFGIRDLNQAVAGPIGVVNDGSGGGQSVVWADAVGTWAENTQTWGGGGPGGGSDSLRDYSLVLANANSLNQQDTTDSVSLASSMVKSGITLGQPDRIKMIKAVHVRADNSSGDLLVRVGAALTPNGSVSFSPEVTVNSENNIANVIAVGKYLTVQIRSATDSVWRINGLTLEVEFRGYY